MLQNIKMLLREQVKSTTFAPELKTTQSFLYLKKSNRQIPWKNSRRETAFFFTIHYTQKKRIAMLPSSL